jgi:hypothetical protein
MRIVVPEADWAGALRLRLGAALPRGAEGVLLVDAWQVGGRPYALANCWRAWLAHASPRTPLLALGWRAGFGPGYADLLGLEERPGLWDWARPAGDLPPFRPDGYEALGALRHAAEGHGGTSLLQALTRFCALLDALLLAHADGDAWSEVWEGQGRGAEQLLEALRRRWARQAPYLLPTPLGDALRRAALPGPGELAAGPSEALRALDGLSPLRGQLAQWQRLAVC